MPGSPVGYRREIIEAMAQAAARMRGATFSAKEASDAARRLMDALSRIKPATFNDVHHGAEALREDSREDVPGQYIGDGTPSRQIDVPGIDANRTILLREADPEPAEEEEKPPIGCRVRKLRVRDFAGGGD